MRPYPSRLLVCLVLFSLASCATEKSVRPGINKGFLDPNAKVDVWVKRFEGESREIFAHRARIAAATQIHPGDRVADIGAGTGLFLDLFTKAVGESGHVYAVDLAPTMVAHMRQRIAQKGYRHASVVQCTERSVELPAGSVDLVFLSDTYHHFEYPMSTLASIHKALRPGGRLVIVDFERIPGTSREWVLGHVRCGKEKVTEEVVAAGFRRGGETSVPGLRENYLIHFVRD